MIGNSKIVMLDEPTSGMDTTARRRLWDMLKKNKGDKIVILTTHYMDEADILGDRIAIMSEGDVQCTGSSLFLKKRYGVGYNLVIAKKVRSPLPEVDKFVMDRLPNAIKLQEVSSEITYQLPSESSSLFKQFFMDFDENLGALQLRSYSVGVTTLEEVFLKIGHGEEAERARDENNMNLKAQGEKLMSVKPEDQELEDYSIAKEQQGGFGDQMAGFFDQLQNLSTKKLLTQFRDKQILVIEIVFPVVLLVCMFAFSKVKFINEYPPVDLNVFAYPPQHLYYNADQKVTSDRWQTPEQFIENNVMCSASVCNASHWSGPSSLPADTTLANDTAYFLSFNDKVVEAVANNKEWTYGSIMINQISSSANAEGWRY